MGTDWLAIMEKKRKRRRTIKSGAAITIFALIIGFVVFYIENGPSYYGPGPIEITISPDKPYFVHGENVTFTITVINKQSWPIAHPNSEMTHIEKESIVYQNQGLNVDYPVKVSTYPANTNTIHSWRWFESKNDTLTIQHEPGNYSLTYEISGYGYSASANCTFEIRQNQTISNLGPLQITLTPDKSYFIEGEAVTFRGTIINTQNQSVQYPLLRQAIIEKIIDDSHRIGVFGLDEHHTYNADNLYKYPANSNTSFTWRWHESRSGDQTSPHEPGRYMLTYSISGNGYSASTNCIFQIR